jgi:hypothetical protein
MLGIVMQPDDELTIISEFSVALAHQPLAAQRMHPIAPTGGELQHD